MTGTEEQGTLGRHVAVGGVPGVGSALASVGVLHLIGVDSSPAVIAAVVGAVAGSVVPTVVLRKRKGQAAHRTDAAGRHSAGR